MKGIEELGIESLWVQADEKSKARTLCRKEKRKGCATRPESFIQLFAHILEEEEA